MKTNKPGKNPTQGTNLRSPPKKNKKKRGQPRQLLQDGKGNRPVSCLPMRLPLACVWWRQICNKRLDVEIEKKKKEKRNP